MEKEVECQNCTRLEKKIELLESKINQLERRLLAYENAHTPPSKQQFKKKD